MIKTRIAATAAMFSFGIAAFSGIAAATANADAEGGTVMTPTAEQAVDNARTAYDQQLGAARNGNSVNVPAPGSAEAVRHQAFPETPYGPYTGKPNPHDRGEDAAHTHDPLPMQTPTKNQ